MIAVATWLVLGWAGAALAWWVDTSWVWRQRTCPTPRALIFGLLGGVLGPILMVAAIVISVTEFVRTDLGWSWFTRPICGRGRDRIKP